MPEADVKPCELLLERLTSWRGAKLQLQKLRSVGVPADADVYLCQRTFVSLQVRVKNLDHRPDDLLHEYSLTPEGPGTAGAAGKGGVYELQCLQSKHHVQVKVQPPLGLADLLPEHREEPTKGDLTLLLEKEVWPLLGVFYVLARFTSEPDRKSVTLAPKYADAPKHIEWLLDDSKMLDKLLAKVPVFTRSYESPPTLSLLEPAKPRTRGLLSKALLEVKMLLIRAITQIRYWSDSLSQEQLNDFETLMVYIYEDPCKGGVDAQSLSSEESALALRHLVCGGSAASLAREASVANGKADSSPGAATCGGPVLDKGSDPPPNSLERAQLERFKVLLSEVVEHLATAEAGLDEADLLVGGRLRADRSGIAEISARLRREHEGVEGQLAKAEGGGGAESGSDAKRLRIA